MPTQNPPLTYFDEAIQRGSGAVIRLTITLGGVAQDISTAGTIIVFTAKRNAADATPLFQKSYAAGGAALPAGVAAGGIVANGAVGPNVADVQIHPADTAGLTETTILDADAWYYPPNADAVPVAKGVIRVTALPFTPPA